METVQPKAGMEELETNMTYAPRFAARRPSGGRPARGAGGEKGRGRHELARTGPCQDHGGGVVIGC